MIHGETKALQMARSILPSRWRSAQATRALIHRGERRASHQTMHRLTIDPSLWDDEPEADATCDVEVHLHVKARRGADKLRHFERWAVEKTKHLPREQRLPALRGLLPTGLIGDHARGHLQRHDAFRDPLLSHRWVRRSRLLHRGELAQLLRTIVITPGAHRAFNRLLRQVVLVKANVPVLVLRRPLLGLHDVLPFLDDVHRDRPLRFAVDAVCRAFKAEHFEPEATASRLQLPLELPLHDWYSVRR